MKTGGTTARAPSLLFGGAYFFRRDTMLDLNLIRSNPEFVRAALQKRGCDLDLGELLDWDARRRALLVENESLKAERNRMSKEIPALKKQGKDAAPLLAQLKEMADRNSRLVVVERAVKKGDTANIDFEGFDQGVAFEGGKGEAFDLEIGSGSFVPGFEDQLVGMKAGEEKDIDITFPENYTPELAGKPVVFHVKVNEVKVKELPAIDDEFAKDVSEFDTLKELKADIKKKMTDERTAAAQRAFEDVLMTKVAEGIKADIPDEMIEMQAHQMLEGFKQQLASQGIPFDQYTKMTGMNEEQIIMDAKEPATNQVRMDLAIRAIIKAENLEVSDEEVENEMKSVAEKYGMDLDTVKKYLRAEDVKEQVMREKVIKVVADSATAVAPEVKEEETKTEEEEEKKD